MKSTDPVYTGAGNATPPVLGLSAADRVVLMPGCVAPWIATGLPTAGAPAGVRLRGLTAAAGTTGTTTGAFLGATARPSVQTAQREFAVIGAPSEHISSTPGDLPPEDPLS